METILKLVPLLVLIAVAVYFISRGSRTKPDPDSNRHGIGGGSGDNRANE